MESSTTHHSLLPRIDDGDEAVRCRLAHDLCRHIIQVEFAPSRILRFDVVNPRRQLETPPNLTATSSTKAPAAC